MAGSNDANFLQRMRHERVGGILAASLETTDDVYVANLAEAMWTSGAKLATTLTAAKAGLHPDLALEISILEDGVVRFLVDEVNPKKPRYKVQDVVIEDNLILVTRESSLGEV